jgi:N-acetylmuramoyl-L-alanine amidase
MPSVLVETGYLSNRQEEDYLSGDDGQRTLANALLTAFEQYRYEMEGGVPRTALQLLPLTQKTAGDLAATTTPTIGGGPAVNASARPVLTNFPDGDGRNRQGSERPSVSSTPAGDGRMEYRVQLLASPVEVRQTGEKWSKLTYLVEVRQEDNYYKYQVCNLASENEAHRVKEQVRSAGFHDAFIVTYRDGRRSK